MSFQRQVVDCLNCAHEHYFEEELQKWLCTNPRCYCRNFIRSEQSLEAHQKYLRSIKVIEEKVEYMLKNIPQTRNLETMQFIFAYWHLNSGFSVGMVLDSKTYIHLDATNTIARTRRRLKRENPEYKAYDPNITFEMYQKELGFLAWVLQIADVKDEDWE